MQEQWGIIIWWMFMISPYDAYVENLAITY